MRPEHKHLYGWEWRAVIRPWVLRRAGDCCERCHRPSKPLDVAHLDGDPANRDESNLAALCRACHRRHDHASWALKCHETRSPKKDAQRPLLAALETP